MLCNRTLEFHICALSLCMRFVCSSFLTCQTSFFWYCHIVTLAVHLGMMIKTTTGWGCEEPKWFFKEQTYLTSEIYNHTDYDKLHLASLLAVPGINSMCYLFLFHTGCTWTAFPPSERSSSTVRKADAVSSSKEHLAPCLQARGRWVTMMSTGCLKMTLCVQ